MANITLASLQNPGQKSDSEGEAPKGTFKAETLTCTITAPDGTVVAQTQMVARSYKPGKNGKGGVGWYAALNPRDDDNPKGGSYRGVGVNGGLRLSVNGLKIGADDSVDLTPAEE